MGAKASGGGGLGPWVARGVSRRGTRPGSQARRCLPKAPSGFQRWGACDTGSTFDFAV
jgi:hypothetical protein